MTTSDELAHASHTPTARTDPEARPREDLDVVPWIPHGISSGVLGAAIVAGIFLVIDVLEGRPFWTPTALGSAFFRGEPLAADASPEPVLIAGYTAMHGTVFVALGLMAAYVLASGPRRQAPAGLALAGLLFLAFEAVFLAYTAVFDAGLTEAYGFGTPAAANLLAAGAMAAYLTRFAHSPAA